MHFASVSVAFLKLPENSCMQSVASRASVAAAPAAKMAQATSQEAMAGRIALPGEAKEPASSAHEWVKRTETRVERLAPAFAAAAANTRGQHLPAQCLPARLVRRFKAARLAGFQEHRAAGRVCRDTMRDAECLCRSGVRVQGLAYVFVRSLSAARADWERKQRRARAACRGRSAEGEECCEQKRAPQVARLLRTWLPLRKSVRVARSYCKRFGIDTQRYSV